MWLTSFIAERLVTNTQQLLAIIMNYHQQCECMHSLTDSLASKQAQVSLRQLAAEQPCPATPSAHPVLSCTANPAVTNSPPLGDMLQREEINTFESSRVEVAQAQTH